MRKPKYKYDDLTLRELEKETGIKYSTLYHRIKSGQHPLDKPKYTSYHHDENGRVCTKCKEYKTWDCFYKNSRGINKKSYVCILCT